MLNRGARERFILGSRAWESGKLRQSEWISVDQFVWVSPAHSVFSVAVCVVSVPDRVCGLDDGCKGLARVTFGSLALIERVGNRAFFGTVLANCTAFESCLSGASTVQVPYTSHLGRRRLLSGSGGTRSKEQRSMRSNVRQCHVRDRTADRLRSSLSLSLFIRSYLDTFRRTISLQS